MKFQRNYSNFKKTTNIKPVDKYYTSKKDRYSPISLTNKNKKNVIKPPFKQGLYSYKQSFNTLQNGYNQNIYSNNFHSQNSPNSNFKNKKENSILNINNIQPWGGSHISNNNSSLSFSSINLNKYKINSNSSQNNKNINFNNNNTNIKINHNNNFNNNNNSYIDNHLNNDNNVNNLKNTNISLNMNININGTNNNNNNNMKKIYQNYYNDNPKYEKESRRMMIEYIKILGLNDIKQTILDNNLSLKVLNQKYNETENNNNYNNNQELFGEDKKKLYLKNLNYSLSYESFRSNNEEISHNKINDILNIDNLNNIVFIKDKKKINILNFLLVPRILNLIEEDENIPQKCIFLITLDKIYFMEGKESYLFQWRNINNNEIDNEFNLKDIKSCNVSKKYNNRFIIEVEKEDIIDNMKFEIETPSKDICNNYVIGINYLLK